MFSCLGEKGTGWHHAFYPFGILEGDQWVWQEGACGVWDGDERCEMGVRAGGWGVLCWGHPLSNSYLILQGPSPKSSLEDFIDCQWFCMVFQ